MQLVVDHVPYECSQVDENMIIMQSDHFAKLLTVRDRFREKYAGFLHDGTQFVYVDADEEAGTVTFSSSFDSVTIDMLEDWMFAHLQGINSIAYEVLKGLPKD